MPRPLKIEEPEYEKIIHWGKVFIYTDPSWNVLFPIVDVIRILPKNTMIEYRYGKGQNIIKTYGFQYNYRTMGVKLETKDDYLNALYKGNCKFIFIFSDKEDYVSKTLL